MISRLRNWWGTLPASSERAPKTSPSASAPLGTAPSVLATPKDEQPNKATVPDGRELFLAASSAEEREQVLKNHPFWQTKDVELQLGVAEVAAVIEHVSELYAKYHFRLSHPRSIHLRDGESRIEDMRGIQWGQRSMYSQWHQRAVSLLKTHPNESSVLLNAIQKHVEATCEGNGIEWLEEAEDLLRLGGAVSTPAMLNGLLIRAQARRFEDMDIDFDACPRITQEFRSIEREAGILRWVQDHYARAQLVAMNHPRLDGWTLAEHIPKKELIVLLAEHVKDGALLKAWHGIALTGEETLQHPLAYSLYVHKHAPIYLEEARPLPDAWSMALSLSTTGLEFKEILLNAAHLKMNPEQKPETITLPALEV